MWAQDYLGSRSFCNTQCLEPSYSSISRQSLREYARLYSSRMASKISLVPTHSLFYKATLPCPHQNTESVSFLLQSQWSCDCFDRQSMARGNIEWLLEMSHKEWFSLYLAHWHTQGHVRSPTTLRLPYCGAAQVTWRDPCKCPGQQSWSSSHSSQVSRHMSKDTANYYSPHLSNHPTFESSQLRSQMPWNRDKPFPLFTKTLTQRMCEHNRNGCCFEPLSFGVICYRAIVAGVGRVCI